MGFKRTETSKGNSQEAHYKFKALKLSVASCNTFYTIESPVLLCIASFSVIMCLIIYM